MNLRFATRGTCELVLCCYASRRQKACSTIGDSRGSMWHFDTLASCPPMQSIIDIRGAKLQVKLDQSGCS
jgi:hypothetical protein